MAAFNHGMAVTENGNGLPRRKHRPHDDEEQGKLFVGGLSWDTTQQTLLTYFERFGAVVDCVVMKNAESGRSRGFGFVTYADPSNIDVVLASCPHTLDGRTIDPKSCNPRSMQKPKKSTNNLPKVFLGGLPSNITETDLRTFFSRYGEVCEVVIMYDQEKKKSRGFGFLSYADEMSVNRACVEHFVNIQNKQVEIKRAEPRTIPGKETPMDQWGNITTSMQTAPSISSSGPSTPGPPPTNGHHHISHHQPVPPPPPPAYSSWGAPPVSAVPSAAPTAAPPYPTQYGSPPSSQWGHPPPPQPHGVAPHQPSQWGSPPPAPQPPTQYPPGVYPSPATPQPPANYWGTPPGPTPPQTPSDPYSQMHVQAANPPTAASPYNVYGGYSQYQTPPSVSQAAPIKPPHYTGGQPPSTGGEYYHQPAVATSPVYQQHPSDGNLLGPQRGTTMYTQPSQYHPYRRS